VIRRRSPAAGVALAVVLLAATSWARGADREPLPAGAVRDGEHYYQLVVASTWQPLDPPVDTLLAYQAPGARAHLAVTRVDIGRTGQGELDRVADEIERGVSRETAGYRRVKRKLTTSGVAPILELVYRRKPGSDSTHDVVMTRFLLFRRHTVVLSIGMGRKAPRAIRKAAEAQLASFSPYLP
jgi:hypothetical protein